MNQLWILSESKKFINLSALGCFQITFTELGERHYNVWVESEVGDAYLLYQGIKPDFPPEKVVEFIEGLIIAAMDNYLSIIPLTESIKNLIANKESP